jgi:hypothetical protein
VTSTDPDDEPLPVHGAMRRAALGCCRHAHCYSAPGERSRCEPRRLFLFGRFRPERRAFVSDELATIGDPGSTEDGLPVVLLNGGDREWMWGLTLDGVPQLFYAVRQPDEQMASVAELQGVYDGDGTDASFIASVNRPYSDYECVPLLGVADGNSPQTFSYYGSSRQTRGSLSSLSLASVRRFRTTFSRPWPSQALSATTRASSGWRSIADLRLLTKSSFSGWGRALTSSIPSGAAKRRKRRGVASRRTFSAL